MDDEFLSNFEKFELMAFFSGYAILYVFLNVIWRREYLLGVPMNRILSCSYVLTATLFLLYTARKLYFSSVNNTQSYFFHPFLYLFGLLAVVFWIPALNKRSLLLLFHSLVFFALIPLDIISYFGGVVEREQIKNDMNILTLSFFLSVSTAIIALLILWLIDWLRKRPSNREIL